MKTQSEQSPKHGPSDSKDAIDFLIRSLKTDLFEVFPLAGDASNRQYFRIVHDKKSWVLMQWEPFVNDGRYPFLNVLDHFSESGVHVPEVVAMAPEKGFVLLEDLGDLTLERKFWETQNQKLVLPFYQQAIDELLKIHYSTQATDKSNCIAFNVEFNVEKFLWEMNYAYENLMKCIDAPDDPQKDDIYREFKDICETLHAEPKVICHRDYHSRNVMIKLGKSYVIDFQDARMGPIQYDLVSLLHDSYVNLTDEMRFEILNDYHEKARNIYGQSYDNKHFDYIFKIQTIQRCFKACGSFSSFLNLRNDRRYLHYIQPTLVLVHKVLVDLGHFPAMTQWLESAHLLQTDYEAL